MIYVCVYINAICKLYAHSNVSSHVILFYWLFICAHASFTQCFSVICFIINHVCSRCSQMCWTAVLVSNGQLFKLGRVTLLLAFGKNTLMQFSLLSCTDYGRNVLLQHYW